jgi:hypothetical protein
LAELLRLLRSREWWTSDQETRREYLLFERIWAGMVGKEESHVWWENTHTHERIRRFRDHLWVLNVSLLGILHLSVTASSGEGRHSYLPTYVATAITARGGLKRPLSPITNPLLDCRSNGRASCPTCACFACSPIGLPSGEGELETQNAISR